MRRPLALLLLLVTLAPLALLRADIPFLWLDAPKGRDNAFDQKNPNYKAPTQIPIVLNTYTNTPSRTITATFSVSPSITDSPTQSNTPTPSRTATPSSTDTPYAGSATNTDTPSPSYTNTNTSTITLTESPSNTPSPTPTASPTPAGVKFEDFENGTPLSPGPYGAGPIPTSSWDAVEYMSTSHSWKLNTSSSGWGAGINISSNYGVINASGALSLSFYLKSDQNATFTVRFSENQIGIENENWRSPGLSVMGGAGWKRYDIDLSTFVEDAYGDPACAGTCNAQGNGIMELAALDKFEIQFDAGLAGANIFIDDVYFMMSLAPTPTPTFTPSPFAGSPTFTPTSTPYVAVIFEDFEGAGLVAPTNFGDVGSSSTYAIDSSQAYTGAQSMGLLVTSAGWGAGVNFGSNNYDGMGIVNASGATQYRIAVRADQAFTFGIRFKEGDATENGGDLENWVSPDQNYATPNAWQVFTIPIALFNEDNYGDGSCSPSCGATGNNTKDLQSIKRGEIFIVTGPTGISIWLDDITFLLPFGTPTITPTYSTSPTITPTLTPCTPSATFGRSIIGTFVNNPIPSSWPDTSQYVLSTPGSAQSIAGYVGNTGGGQMQFMIYSNGASKPQTLLAASAPFTPVSGWNTVVIPPTYLVAGTYWLAWQAQNANTGVYYDGGAANCCAYNGGSNAFGSPPATYPSGFTDNQMYSLYVNYCP